MKTLKLLEHYMSLLEQDVAEVEETGVEETDVEVEEVPPSSPGLQAIAKLIAAAFVYPPTDDDADAIEEIELLLVGTHNEAPPISNINPRSVIESVVDKLPVQLRAVYIRGRPGIGPGVRQDLRAEDEIYLAQILADAFRYRPTDQESHIAGTVRKEVLDIETPDPTKLIETIQRLIQLSDEPVRDELQDIQ